MRVRVMIAALLSALLAGGLVAGPAGAQDEDDHPDEVSTTTTAPPDGAVGIGDEIYLTGATITSPTGEPARTFDAYHAAVFVQSFIAAAFFGGPEIVRDPPAELPVHRVDVSGSWVGETGTVTVYYATDGTTAYIAFPGIIVWTDPTGVPPPSNWFTPLPRVIEAFNGEAELIDTAGTEMATVSSTTAPEPVDEDDEAAARSSDGADGSDSSSLPLVGAGAGVVVLLAAGTLWMRRRRPAEPD